MILYGIFTDDNYHIDSSKNDLTMIKRLTVKGAIQFI